MALPLGREGILDIATALTLLGQATRIVKDLRELDKGFDLAAMKAQMANLYGTLADVKIALSDAREAIHDKEKKIKELEDKIAAVTFGETCPICSEGRMKVSASHEHPHFGFAGVQERILRCDKCGHSEKRFHDPNERTKSR
jgi:C4-type Zn-finger protein